jgi:hypothetical protein
MFIPATKPLFAWDCLEDSPSLATLRQLLATIRDAKLLAALRAWRGKGRDDYPIHVLWGVFLLRIMLRHPTMEACLAELRRNDGLRMVIGIESEKQVPNIWNMSRFEEVLGEEPHRSLMTEIFNQQIRTLGEVVPDLGRDTAGDATHLSARAAAEATAQAEVAAGLPQPSGGRKEYTDDDGQVTKAIEWFGFKLHLQVDVKHEVALAYHITEANAGDGETLPKLVAQAKNNLPPGRIRTLAYDKAADTNDVHELLSQEHIRAVIQNRSLWKSESERMLPGHDGNSNIVYDEAGTVYCYDRVSQPMVRHPMAYIGYEPDRETLKYRCPAMHGGWECPMMKLCNEGLKYGKTVRVPRETDLRRFPAIPRATKQFERLYKGRTSSERVNARLKIFWGMDDGNLRGSRRFHANVGAVMIVHAAFATVLAALPRREGTTLGGMKLSPIARALQSKLGSAAASPSGLAT